MAAYLEIIGSTLAGFFAIMNPIANAPIFLGLTQGMTGAERKRTALQATLVAFFVVTAFLLLGQVIFSLFGITVAAFRLAGGIIVFSIGFKMLQGEASPTHHTKRAKAAGAAAAEAAAHPETMAPPSEADTAHSGAISVAVSPLGVPLLAGPGTIVTAIGYSGSDWLHTAVTLGAFLILCVVTWLTFLGAERVVRLLGHAFLTVVTRLMGLILAVVGTQMFLHGWREAGL